MEANMKNITSRQALGCVVVLERRYHPHHFEEFIMFLSDRGVWTPFRYFEEYLGVHPSTRYRRDNEVLAYYPNQSPDVIEEAYGSHPLTNVTKFPYPYSATPEQI